MVIAGVTVMPRAFQSSPLLMHFVGSAGYWRARLSSGALVLLFYYVLTNAGKQEALLFADAIFMMAGGGRTIF